MTRSRENYDPGIWTTRKDNDVDNLRSRSQTLARTISGQFYPDFNLSLLTDNHHMCELYSLDVPEGRKILKIFPYARLAAGEARLLSEWKSLGIPVPNIIQADLSCLAVPYSFVVMDFIPFDKKKNLDSLENQEMPGILTELARYLRVAHQIKVQNYGWINFHTDGSGDNAWSETIRKVLDARGRLLVSKRILDKNVLKDFESIAQEAVKTVGQGFLLHGDLTPSNILLRDDQVVGVIDPDPIGGDGLYDLAYLLTSSMALYGEEYEEFALAMYLKREPTQDELNRMRIYQVVALMKQVGASIKWNPNDYNLSTRINRLQDSIKRVLR